MIKQTIKFLTVVALTASTLAFAATTSPTTQTVFQKNAANAPALIPSPPVTNAQAYVLMDANSGTIIAEKNMDQRRAPASLTKLMVLYITESALARGQLALDTPIQISKKAWETGGSKMFVEVNKAVPVEKLIQGIIVDSGNDATVALAQGIAGSVDAFVGLMNDEAQRLGMKNTHFVDVDGLPEKNHYSSAHDLAILARAIINDYSQYYHFFSQKYLTYSGIKQSNRNLLLWRYAGTDGLKTGHTKEAGYCLIASAKRNGMRLIAVAMGAPTFDSRDNDDQALLVYGFRFFETKKIYDANTTVESARIWMGKNKDLSVGLTSPLFVTTPTGQGKNITTQATLDKKIQAPVQQGQTLGQLTVKLNNKVIATRPLVALASDPEGGIIRKSTDKVISSVEGFFGGGKS